MAHTTSDLPPARHVPARTNQGWPVAVAIVALAVVVNTAVYLLHERTSSRNPMDPMFRSAGDPTTQPTGAPAGGHGDGQVGQGGRGHGGTAP